MKRSKLFETAGRTLLITVLAVSAAAAAKPTPRVFRVGHYRLADGIVRTGQLCLVSDNELLVKSADTARIKKYAAVEVKNFVVATDSFVVLRNIDVVVNEVVSRYPSAMVQVCRPAGRLELHQLRGPMEVYGSTNGSKTALWGVSGLRNGLAGAVVGAATGAMLDKNSGQFKEQEMTVFLLRRPGTPALQTLQPKTRSACDLLRATVADDAALSASVRYLSASSCTPETILNVLTQYAARATTNLPKP